MARIHPTAGGPRNAADEGGSGAAAGGGGGGATSSSSRPPPPPPSRPPAHSSAPSVALPAPAGRAIGAAASSSSSSSSAHNRNVTPHTESLMNLFARPPVAVTTPATPTPKTPRDDAGAGDGALGGGGLPLMPDYGDADGGGRRRQRRPETPEPIAEPVTPRRTNSKEKIRPTTEAKDFPSPLTLSLIHPSNLARGTTAKADNTGDGGGDPFRGQDTASTRNRDETLAAHNLKKKDKGEEKASKEEEERKFINGILASANETSWLLETRRPSAKEEDAAAKVRPEKSSPPPSCDPDRVKSTLVGAFLYSLYQLVFCFAEASAITRPSRPPSASAALLGPMALMACVGSLMSGPMLITALGGQLAALYPCLDMFMAPFLGQMASDIDDVLVTLQGDGDGGSGDDAAAFLATFVALNAFGMLTCGLLCVLAGKVKLANLAGFLPYPVLAGFFSSVGISVWISAFKVDTGVTVQRAISAVVAGGSWTSLGSDFARHAPSFVAGAALYVLGPRGPPYILGIISATIGFAYLTMHLTDTSLEEARDMSYFWKKEEVMMSREEREFGRYGPPAAFGLWNPGVMGNVCWPAFANGMANVVAMSVIYLLRCSLHAAAVIKNDAQRKSSEATESHPLSLANGDRTSQSSYQDDPATAALEMEQGHEPTKPKGKRRDLMTWYANSLFAAALVGGFAVLPAVAIGGIFSKIGATSRAPQLGAMVVLLGCYLSDFFICAYIPKCTFSSLLVMAAIDLMHSWFVKSYRKSAAEWVVVPFIVVTSLYFGMLQSVGLGLGASTLIFVASFYRAGVVKFIANGLTIRSTIERNGEDNTWLCENADLIQLLVLQNYLFFGNASSCLKYIRSMFDEEAGGHDDPDLPPIPKYVILDLSIVTGIDTSAVDVLDEISGLCRENGCNLILAGIPRVIKPQLVKGGVKPSRKNKHLSFSPDLDSALGKAEDELLKFVGHNEERAADAGAKLRHRRRLSRVDHGLRHALREIDAQHNISMANHLQTLERYTAPIEMNPGEHLNDGGHERNLVRGLYFVEAGILRCDHDSSASLTRGTRSGGGLFAAPHMRGASDSIGRVNARSATVGRTANLLKQNPHNAAAILGQDQVFRLARIGPGWIIGSISEFLGQDIPGTYTALTPCRVHHLSFETLEELEVDAPVLILHLYKLLSHLSARRQEMTIGQLATMRSIFSSTAPARPISRKKMAKLCAHSSH